MKSVLKFQNNAPVEIALAFAQGKVTPSNFGADQVMYTLAHPPDHITFVDLSASQKINMLRASQGERLVICKRKGADRNSPVRWDVSLAPSAEMARAATESGVPLKENGRPAWGEKPPARAPAAADPDSPLERELRGALGEVGRQVKAANAPAVHAPPTLEEALKAAVSAAHAATQHAKSIGYAGMPAFTGEDLRAMAGTLIDCSNVRDAGKRQ